MSKNYTFEKTRFSKDCIITVTEIKRTWFGFGKKKKYVKRYRGHGIYWCDAVTGKMVSLADELWLSSIYVMNKMQ
jgi:hypothetical protein